MASQNWGTNIVASDGGTPLENVRVQMVEFGALPNATTKNVAHGIASLTLDKVIRVSGVADDGTTVISLPHADTVAATTITSAVELALTVTNITAITAVDKSAFTNCKMFIEYLQ